MNYKIVILPETQKDYRESLLWYKDINPKLAKRFNQSFKESLSIIKKNPLLFQIRYDEVRIKMLTTFPYLIHYTIYKNNIVIKSIYHSSREGELNLF
jgi:hypothetical protein